MACLEVILWEVQISIVKIQQSSSVVLEYQTWTSSSDKIQQTVRFPPNQYESAGANRISQNTRSSLLFLSQEVKIRVDLRPTKLCKASYTNTSLSLHCMLSLIYILSKHHVSPLVLPWGGRGNTMWVCRSKTSCESAPHDTSRTFHFNSPRNIYSHQHQSI